MKIICPECSASFDVPVPLMGAGRRVRCSHCGHVWMQAPVDESGTFGSFRAMEGDSGIDPIPASVHPRDDQDNDDEDKGPGFFSDVKWGALGRMVAGFALGWVVIGVFIYALAAMHAVPGFMKPLAAGLGSHAGADMQGLAVQNVNAKTADGATLVTGKLFNGSEMPRIIPMIEVTPIAADGTPGEGKRVKPEQDTLKPQEIIDFQAELQAALEPGTDVRVRLLAE